jgi:hypothetical protein
MDAFDGGRSWNARLRDGGMKATDFNQNGVIPTCQSDMAYSCGRKQCSWNHYSMISVVLPTQWAERTGVRQSF